MPAGTAAGPDTNTPKRQIQIIVDDNQVFWTNAILAPQSHHALTAAVHVGLRFGKHDLVIFKRALSDESVANYFSDLNVILRRYPIDDQETQIMPRSLVSAARIAETNDQFHLSLSADRD
jgi:hypothetical protein